MTSSDARPAAQLPPLTFTPGLSTDERRALGAQRRAEVPVAALAQVPAVADRVDPLAVLHAQDASRVPSLIPLRYERMAADPFSFLRGAAAVMAADLGALPSSGIRVQLCGDAHLANFGMFASVERDLVFDVNDFDETLPGSFDWDVRRLVASAAVAAQVAGHGRKTIARAAREAAHRYRATITRLSGMTALEAWYVKLDVSKLSDILSGSSLQKEITKEGRKAQQRTSDTSAAKLTTMVNGRRRFRSEPPLLVPLSEDDPTIALHRISPVFKHYLTTLEPDRVALLEHFTFSDLARKVVGVGSVGTRAGIILLESGDGDALILQIKQATASVLEPYMGASSFQNHAQRVVVGQRLMQATGDPFLGWVREDGDDPQDYYVRQLRDMKGSVDVARLDKEGLVHYAGLCGAVLARAHGRVGDSAMVSGYLGTDEEFDDAMSAFAVSYVDINDGDHARLVAERASRTGEPGPDSTT